MPPRILSKIKTSRRSLKTQPRQRMRLVKTQLIKRRLKKSNITTKKKTNTVMTTMASITIRKRLLTRTQLRVRTKARARRKKKVKMLRQLIMATMEKITTAIMMKRARRKKMRQMRQKARVMVRLKTRTRQMQISPGSHLTNQRKNAAKRIVNPRLRKWPRRRRKVRVMKLMRLSKLLMTTMARIIMESTMVRRTPRTLSSRSRLPKLRRKLARRPPRRKKAKRRSKRRTMRAKRRMARKLKAIMMKRGSTESMTMKTMKARMKGLMTKSLNGSLKS